jgi:ParB family chromosome partitioning protein
MAKKALGKGLGAIISASPTPVEEIEKTVSEHKERVIEIELDKIIPNPDQPRTFFDENEILGLAESITSVGLIQPVIVRKKGSEYIIVAGERRYRACRLNQMKTIKAIVIEADEEQNFTLALIENIQRQDLNPIEEARAYKILINKFKLKQQDLAKRVGKERATISNSMRLLNLADEIQNGIIEKKISSGHAKVLLSVENPDRQKALYNEIVSKDLSVRALESLVNTDKNEAEADGHEKKSSPKAPHLKKMEEDLISRLGTKVEIRHSGNKGKIEISYYSLDDFERIVEMIK